MASPRRMKKKKDGASPKPAQAPISLSPRPATQLLFPHSARSAFAPGFSAHSPGGPYFSEARKWQSDARSAVSAQLTADEGGKPQRKIGYSGAKKKKDGKMIKNQLVSSAPRRLAGVKTLLFAQVAASQAVLPPARLVLGSLPSVQHTSSSVVAIARPR